MISNQKNQTNKQKNNQTKNEQKHRFWSFRPNEQSNSLELFREKITSVKSLKQFKSQYIQNLISNYN